MKIKDYLAINFDELLFDAVLFWYAFFYFFPLTLNSMKIVDYISIDAAILMLYLLFFLLSAYAAVLIRNYGENRFKFFVGLIGVSYFIILIMPLIEGPGTLARLYHVKKGIYECRIAGFGILLIFAGIAAGMLLPFLQEKILKIIPDKEIQKSFILSMKSSGAVLTGVLALCLCFWDQLILQQFHVVTRPIPIASIVFIVLLSGLTLTRLFILFRYPVRRLNLLIGLPVLGLYWYRVYIIAHYVIHIKK